MNTLFLSVMIAVPPPQSTLPAEYRTPVAVVEYVGPIRQEIPYPKPDSSPVPARYKPMPARREVVAVQPFRVAAAECEYDPDHVCNRCGALQVVIARWNADGTHTHVCARCGHSWRHR